MCPKLKKIIAILMTVAILVTSLAALSVGVSAAEDQAGVKKGEYKYASTIYTDEDLTDIYYYSDEAFEKSSTEYNEHLATMSMIMSSASIVSHDTEGSYELQSDNLIHLFREWDFTGYNVNEDYTQKPGEETMGVGIAYKVIGEGEDAYTLLAIVPRSSGYEREWVSNLTVGKDGVHQGFAKARDVILEFAKRYVADNAKRFKGEVKVWTVGYSRGAGVANLLAAYLTDNGEALGVKVEKESIFAYTFATPYTVEYSSEAEKAEIENNYKNIHNRYSANDIVALLPFGGWNFTRYGTSTLLDESDEKKAAMLKFLEKTNKAFYDIYTKENSPVNPDGFKPFMLKLIGGICVADPTYGIPTTQQGFLNSRIDFLTKNLIPNRETYVDGGYEYAMKCLTSLYFGLDAEQSELFAAGIDYDVFNLVTAYYCYYVAERYFASETAGTAAVNVLLNTLSKLEAGIGKGSSVISWHAYATEFMKSESYLKMKSALKSMAADPSLVSSGAALVKEALESFVTGITGKMLGGGVNALTIDEEEKTKLYATVTSDEVTVPLTRLAAYMLLGSDDKIPTDLDLSNKNIAIAVTLYFNAERYTAAHSSEIILSWLRAEDSYYKDENWHIHETELISDADGHFERCGCGYEGEKVAHIFGEWSTLPVTNGEKQQVVRRCHCGYEEFKEYQGAGNKGIFKNMDKTTIILICVGSAVVIAGAVATVVVLKKKKTQK